MSSLADRNVPLFIGFRVLFNARWYYPILAVFFLDFGLTLEQYALLNVAWAATIVLLEVPSGALADVIGRRRIIVLAGALMVLEFVILAFTPLGSSWLFPLFLLNRILSGAAEACASGADESLAYDSLRAEGREQEWSAVLGRLMRWQSAAFFVAMLAGAAVYDADLVQRVTHALGWNAQVSPQTTMRFPIFLTLANAVGVFLLALRMRDPEHVGTTRPAVSAGATLRQILAAGRWILRTPAVLFVIGAGLWIDPAIRLFLTIGANYYRLIALPEASFGLIGASMALLGMAASAIAVRMAVRFPTALNFAITGALAFAGLFGASWFLPRWGVIAVVPLGLAMSLVGFFLSHTLNARVTDSGLRATVLSFKGLLFNLAYGVAGLLFAGYTRARATSGTQDSVFMEALRVLPWTFLVCGLGIAGAGWMLSRRSGPS
ncbi:MAG: transporter [Chthoniobacter sp.]|nr:transporter [Chthoniobacter sp.]